MVRPRGPISGGEMWPFPHTHTLTHSHTHTHSLTHSLTLTETHTVTSMKTFSHSVTTTSDQCDIQNVCASFLAAHTHTHTHTPQYHLRVCFLTRAPGHIDEVRKSPQGMAIAILTSYIWARDKFVYASIIFVSNLCMLILGVL